MAILEKIKANLSNIVNQCSYGMNKYTYYREKLYITKQSYFSPTIRTSQQYAQAYYAQGKWYAHSAVTSKSYNATYDVPISIVLPYSFPIEPPIISLEPSPGVTFKPTQYHHNNRVLMPILQKWNPSIPLQQVIAQLLSFIATDPPINKAVMSQFPPPPTMSKPLYSPYGFIPSSYPPPVQSQVPVSPSYPYSMYNPHAQQPQYPPTYGSAGYGVPNSVKPDNMDIQRKNIMQKKAQINKECYEDALKYLSRISEIEKKMITTNNQLVQSIQSIKENKNVSLCESQIAKRMADDIKTSDTQKEICEDDVVNMVTGNNADVAHLLKWEAKRQSIEKVIAHIRSQSLKGSIEIDDYLSSVRMLSSRVAKYNMRLTKLLKLM